jgi:hypothetical protein
VIHSDHCAKKLLPWFDGMLKADEDYFQKTGEPLFSSHMLDLSEESKEENIETCVKYFQRMAKINVWLEMEIGITGGEEDGVNNEDVDNASLYTQPEDIVIFLVFEVWDISEATGQWEIYKALSAISPMFSIAAAFGNVHGVYSAHLPLFGTFLFSHRAGQRQAPPRAPRQAPGPLQGAAQDGRPSPRLFGFPRRIGLGEARDRYGRQERCRKNERRHGKCSPGGSGVCG